jgi:hypothetical protein
MHIYNSLDNDLVSGLIFLDFIFERFDDRVDY